MMQSHSTATTKIAPIKAANCHNSAVKRPPSARTTGGVSHADRRPAVKRLTRQRAGVRDAQEAGQEAIRAYADQARHAVAQHHRQRIEDNALQVRVGPEEEREKVPGPVLPHGPAAAEAAQRQEELGLLPEAEHRQGPADVREVEHERARRLRAVADQPVHRPGVHLSILPRALANVPSLLATTLPDAPLSRQDRRKAAKREAHPGERDRARVRALRRSLGSQPSATRSSTAVLMTRCLASASSMSAPCCASALSTPSFSAQSKEAQTVRPPLASPSRNRRRPSVRSSAGSSATMR